MALTKYKTKQREEILRFFEENSEECFSVRDVCRYVSAGEATVFRAVASLADEGLLTKFKGESGERAYYRYSCCAGEGHIHLVCSTCGEMIHADCGFMKEIIAHFSDSHSFSVDCGRTVIYGECGVCRGAREGGMA